MSESILRKVVAVFYTQPACDVECIVQGERIYGIPLCREEHAAMRKNRIITHAHALQSVYGLV